MARRGRLVSIDPGPPPTELSGRTGGFNPVQDAAFLNGPHNDHVRTCPECGDRITFVANQAGNGVDEICGCDDSPAD